MVDFILLTNEQALVDQLDSFELHFDLCEGEEGIRSLTKGTILLLDLSDESIDLDHLGNLLPEGVYGVALVQGYAKKAIKKLLDDHKFLYAHLSYPLIKADVVALLEDLGTYATSSSASKGSDTRHSQKFDLEFSLFEDETKEEEKSLAPDELKKLSKKLGNFDFFEDKEFAADGEENLRVQQKFDTVFLGESSSAISEAKKSKPHDSLDLNNFQIENDHIQDDDMSSKNNKGLDFNLPKLEFDEAPAPKKEDTQQRSNLDFDLEFGDSEVAEEGQDVEVQKALDASKKAQEESGGHESIGLSFEDDLGLEIESQNHNPEATSKTIVFDRNSLKTETAKAAEVPEGGGLDFSSLESEEEITATEDDGLDFSSAGDTDSSAVKTEAEGAGLDFNSLDTSEEFSLDLGKDETPVAQSSQSVGGLELGSSDEEFEIENKGSKKTSPLESLGSHSTSDYMSSAEARVNIENTIKDIIRPDLSQSSEDKTGDLDLNELAALDEEVNEKTLVADPGIFTKDGAEEGGIDFGSEFNYGKTDPSNKGFKTVEDISFETGDRGKNLEEAIQETRSNYKIPDSLEGKGQNHLVFKNMEREEEVAMARGTSRRGMEADELIQSERRQGARSAEYSHGNYQDEDFVRAQATIRQLREELDEQLIELKQLRRENKELEQENLSLRAQSDELKIEQNILRKRHLAETEDLKYQLQLADEKRLTAEERLKHSEKHREKLEQKLRLDFSQVRQREKELENQLELLSIDHDTQIQTRDSKILELRRKIESLEFNMENASIREQKTNEDKKKLEDKLVKIMKTLRHSIENIDEDDHRASYGHSDVNSDDE